MVRDSGRNSQGNKDEVDEEHRRGLKICSTFRISEQSQCIFDVKMANL
jgi:hypothetical protein